ncbi:MAG: D-threo-aldose 1-dehydrogenase [Pseudonocardiales bacterium]|jgi:D-threo-aldose 1-dehydrogenase|nr:D-threo-aldose 1-dehydrogenase [Pseudonocardiales bacterium]
MNRRRIGRTEVRVSEVGFGGAPLGNLFKPVSEDDALATVRTAWDGGVRYFDTAPHYGLGLSERRLGAALRDVPRDEYVLSTKIGRLLVNNPAPTGSDLTAGGFAVPDTLTRRRDYSRDGVRRSLDASLDRLGLDRVDIVYVHDAEDHLEQALGEAVPALVELREEGVIGAIGAGMNFVGPLLRFVTESDVDAVMLAGRWTLADRTGEPLLAACAERGVSLVAAAPFNSGLLARPHPADGAHFDYGPAPADVLAFARRLATACDAAGATLPHAAMQFPLRHPTVPTVVVGMHTPAQASANLDWVTRPLPAALWAELAALDAERPAALTSTRS